MRDFLTDPSFATALAFVGFLLVAGRYLIAGIKDLIQGHRASVQAPMEEIRQLVEEARAALKDAQESHLHKKEQEDNMRSLCMMEVQALEEELKKMLKEEESTAEFLYQQHVKSIVTQWKEKFQEDILAEMKKSLTEMTADLPPSASHAYADCVLSKALPEAPPVDGAQRSS